MILDVTRLDPVRPRRPHERGGEWDLLRGLPPRTLRRLRGARLLGVAGGVGPDDLADQVRRQAGEMTDCDALTLWEREASRMIEERRREARRRRERRIADRAGCDSWWSYRASLAAAAGHPSVHSYAKARGWRP